MYEIFAIVLYFSLLFSYVKLKQKKGLTHIDFVIGKRSLNKWTTALAAHASDMSNWLFMAYPGAVFVMGGLHIWTALGLILIMWVNWTFIAPKIRVETEKKECITLCGFFESKLDQNWPSGRILTSIVLFVFYTVYVAAVLCGIGLLLNTLFHLPHHYGAIIGILLVLPFLLIGGYSTLAQLDLFQGIFLLCVILFTPLYIIHHTGGMGAMMASVAQNGRSFSLFGGAGISSIGGSLLLMFGWGLGYLGQPHILTKFMGIKNPEEISASKKIGLSWQVISLLAATLVGFVGIAVFNTLENPENVFIALVREFFPPFVSGIFLCAIIAAIINAMSSMLLVLSTTIAEDFYRRFSKSVPSEKKQLLVTRLACILSAVIALTIALPNFSTIDALVLFAWSGLGASFGPLLIACLFFSRVTKIGAWLGIFSGASIAFFWPILQTNIPALIIAFPVSLFAIFAASYLFIYEKATINE
ncbi:MAG: High-affinity proline transporter PutP [Chlamydiae bacterium]|nr:High-affinity proline transporter PutP [Chlamydiota bacterium]